MKSHQCVEKLSCQHVVVAEKGRKASFQNENGDIFFRVRVDGCLITEGKRADWIVTKNGVGSVIVELKGADLHHACDQILTTIAHHACQEWIEPLRACLIVCSRCPKFDTTLARKQEQLRKAGLKLKIACNSIDIALETLFGIQHA
jgi:hypothetical protein